MKMYSSLTVGRKDFVIMNRQQDTYYINLEQLCCEQSQLISDLILKSRIRIEDIPPKIRTSCIDYYVNALRITRNSKSLLAKTLEFLKNDLKTIDKQHNSFVFTELQNLLYYYRDYD